MPHARVANESYENRSVSFAIHWKKILLHRQLPLQSHQHFATSSTIHIATTIGVSPKTTMVGTWEGIGSDKEQSGRIKLWHSYILS
jgi:hypothetical protein